MKKITALSVFVAVLALAAVSTNEAHAHWLQWQTEQREETLWVKGTRAYDIESIINDIRQSSNQRASRYRNSNTNETKHDVSGGETVHGSNGKNGNVGNNSDKGTSRVERRRSSRSIPFTFAPRPETKPQETREEEQTPNVPSAPTETPDESDLEETDEETTHEEEVTAPNESEDKPNSKLYTDTFAEQLAYEIHRLTNVERTSRGLPALGWDDNLVRIALGHSKDMIVDEFFAHTHPNGCDLTCRFNKANYKAWAWGENIAYIGTSDPSNLAARFIHGWMNSTGHRKNILNEKYTYQGIGVVIDGRYFYATANFANPRN